MHLLGQGDRRGGEIGQAGGGFVDRHLRCADRTDRQTARIGDRRRGGRHPGEYQSGRREQHTTPDGAPAPHSHPTAPKAIRAIASMPKMVPTTSALVRTLGRSYTEKQTAKNGT